jgi:hypothetical protein
MALALNVFQTVTAVVPASPTVIYTAPVGYTAVVLLAQVANIGATSQDITFVHRRSSTDTELLKQYPISANDTSSLLTGKLVLSGSSASNLKFVASLLETLN